MPHDFSIFSIGKKIFFSSVIFLVTINVFSQKGTHTVLHNAEIAKVLDYFKKKMEIQNSMRQLFFK